MTLFSNASQDLFPDNTIGSFTFELAGPIELGRKDDWEVGLCEFSYPPKDEGTLKPEVVVGDTMALID